MRQFECGTVPCDCRSPSPYMILLRRQLLTSRPPRIAQSVTGAGAGMAILYFLRGVLIPLVLAFVLAILVNAVVRLIADRVPRAPRWAVGCSPRWS